MEASENKELELLGLQLRKEQRELDDLVDAMYDSMEAAARLETTKVLSEDASTDADSAHVTEINDVTPATQHAELLRLEAQAEELKLRIRAVNNDFNSKFNPRWGQLFKAGEI
jgi:predicted transcriptional regulator